MLFVKRLAGMAGVVVLCLGLLPLGHSRAVGSASLSLSPSSGSHDVDTTFTVSIYEDSGVDAINAVTSNLSYDLSKLEYVSASNAGSAFNVPVPPSGGSGSVSISSGVIGTLTGSQLVASVTFKALVGSGSADVNFGSDSVITPDGLTNLWDGSTTGGTYTLTTPVPTPSPSPSPTPSPSPSPAPSPSPSPSPSPTPTPTPTPTPASTPVTLASGSVISKVKLTNLGFSTANISITASAPVSLKVLYGAGNKLDNVTPETGLVTAVEVALDKAQLSPGQVYSYKIVATEQSGKQTETSVGQFTTKGFQLKVVLKDHGGNLLRNHQATLHSVVQTATSDENGIVTFDNVALGQHELELTVGSKTYTQGVNVKDNRVTDSRGVVTSAAQDIALVIPASRASRTRLIMVLGAAMTVGIIIVITVIVIRQKRSSSPQIRQSVIQPSQPAPLPTQTLSPLPPPAGPISRPSPPVQPRPQSEPLTFRRIPFN